MARPLALRVVAALAFVWAFLLGAPAWAEAPAARGVTVVVQGDVAAGTVWPLAQAVYASRILRPSGIDEPRARALVGQPSAAQELVELRDGVRDEGAVSRRVIGAIAGLTHASTVAVVRASETPGHVQIRLFSEDRFDVALYDGDPADATWRNDVVRALEHRIDPTAAQTPAVAAAPKPKKPEAASGPRPFYKSPWFWAGFGAAALLGGTVLVVSQVTKNDDIRVHVQPPSGAATSALRF